MVCFFIGYSGKNNYLLGGTTHGCNNLSKLFTETLCNALTKQQTDYIDSTNTKFISIQNQITNLQTLIDSYETSVNSTKTTAITEINAALEQFKKGDFYSKSESDSRYLRYSVDQATNAEAIAGTTVLKWMSPSTTKVAISNQATTLTGNQTVVGTKNFQDGLQLAGKVVQAGIAERPITDSDRSDTTYVTGVNGILTRVGDVVTLAFNFQCGNWPSGTETRWVIKIPAGYQRSGTTHVFRIR